MAIELIGNHRFTQCTDVHSVVDMTTYGTPIPATAPIGTQPSRSHLGAAEPGLGVSGYSLTKERYMTALEPTPEQLSSPR